MLLVTLGLAVVFSFIAHGFLRADNLFTLARSVSALGILGMAMAVVVIGRGLDLSLVASMGVATAGAILLMSQGWKTPLALLVGLGIVIGVGLVNGFLIAFVEIPALFATLATGLLIFGLAQTTWIKNLSNDIPPDRHFVTYLGQGRPLGVPMPLIMFAVAAVLSHLVLSRTLLGRFIYAHGDNAEAASFTGIPIRPLTVAEYVFAAVLGYFAGLIMAGSVGGFTTTVITSSLVYDVLLVVVIGGVSLVGGHGGVISVLAGTALIGVMLNGMTLLNFDVEQQNIAKGLILLAALVLDRRLHPREEETVRQGD